MKSHMEDPGVGDGDEDRLATGRIGERFAGQIGFHHPVENGT
jgi:hypothetical protein